MKALVFSKKNSPEKLMIRDIPMPVPSEKQALVRVCAASVNAADYRSMKLGMVPKSGVLGADIAGVVEQADPASGFAPGDEVMGCLSIDAFGGFAEYAAVPYSMLVHKPESVTREQAACLPIAGITALMALREANVHAGSHVLIYGAGGGVGTFAVQLARHMGAEVTAVCGARNAELVKSLGATRVSDYRKENILRSGGRWDAVLALNGSRPLFSYRRALAPGGRLVLVGGSMWQILRFVVLRPLLSVGSKKAKFLFAGIKHADLEYLMGLVDKGILRPVIDRRYSFAEAAEALLYAAEGHARGKVVISVS